MRVISLIRVKILVDLKSKSNFSFPNLIKIKADFQEDLSKGKEF